MCLCCKMRREERAHRKIAGGKAWVAVLASLAILPPRSDLRLLRQHGGACQACAAANGPVGKGKKGQETHMKVTSGDLGVVALRATVSTASITSAAPATSSTSSACLTGKGNFKTQPHMRLALTNAVRHLSYVLMLHRNLVLGDPCASPPPPPPTSHPPPILQARIIHFILSVAAVSA